MKEMNQLRNLMETIDYPDRNEPWEYNIEEFRRELKAFANELPDPHYRDWLLQIIKAGGQQLMNRVRELADEIPDSHYSDWLTMIATEYNNETSGKPE